MAKNSKTVFTTLHLMSVCRKYLIFKEPFMGVFDRKTQTLLFNKYAYKNRI